MPFKRRGAAPLRPKRAKRSAEEEMTSAKMPLRAVLGRVLVVVLLLLACVVPMVSVASPVSYIPLIAVLVMIALSYAYLRVVSKAIGFSEDSLLDSCERCSAIEFVVTFKNRSPLPVVRLEPCFYISDLFGNIDTALPASMVLMPHEERDFRFEASFDHLGTYSAGVSKIVVSDLLGLFQHTIVNPSRHEVRVLPRIFQVSKLSLDNVSVQESRKAIQAIVTDDMDYAGTRDYEPGDPLKTIHWKLSSRNPRDEYFTRLFESFGNPGIDIILDSSAPAYSREGLMQVFDGVMESALSVSVHAREVGVDASILYTDRHGETKRARALRVEETAPLIEDVPRVKVGEGDEAFELLTRECRSIHGEGNVAFISSHVDERTVSLLLEFKQRKRNPLFFAIVPAELEGDERKEYLRPLRRLDKGQVVYYVISGAGDLTRGEA